MARAPMNPPVYVVNFDEIGGLPAGDTIATSENQMLLLDAIGTKADAPWNGSDPNATVISLLKTIAINTGTT